MERGYSFCRKCGARICFFQTKPNPERNGHKMPGKIPMNWNLITREERQSIKMGIPVPYEPLEHKDKNHFANCNKKVEA